jgi:hypothetical protein
LSDSHNEKLLKKSGKGTAFDESDSLARQGSLTGHAGLGLNLREILRWIAWLGPEPLLPLVRPVGQFWRACAINAHKTAALTNCQKFRQANRVCIIGAGFLAASQHFKDFTLLQTRNTLQTLVL